MKTNIRKVGTVLILPCVVSLALFSRSLLAEGQATDREVKPKVVLSKLFPPIYPPLAQQALIVGDVHLKISVHSDGSIGSVAVIDGHPLLLQYALQSVKQSQFDCEHCGGSGLVERTFTYSFQVSEEKPADSSCCLEEQPPQHEAPTVRVSQSDERITITAPARCICSAEYLGTLMDHRMRLIAGSDALDCGRVKVNGDPKASLRCARHAISNKRAFFVRLDSVGMDSFLSDGFAGDGSGKVYSVQFDSLGWGSSPGVEILDNSHDAVQICHKPVRIRKELSSKGVFMGYRCTPVEE